MTRLHLIYVRSTHANITFSVLPSYTCQMDYSLVKKNLKTRHDTFSMLANLFSESLSLIYHDKLFCSLFNSETLVFPLLLQLNEAVTTMFKGLFGINI